MATFYQVNNKFLLDALGNFAIDIACCCDPGDYGELWKDCRDDSDLIVLEAGAVPADYAWLCIDGVWAPAYNSGESDVPKASTDYLLPPAGTPISCNDLVPFIACPGDLYDPTDKVCTSFPSCEYTEVTSLITPITSYQYQEVLTTGIRDYRYFAQYLGTAVVYANNAYEYVGTSTTTIAESSADANFIGIPAVTCSVADSNGKTVFTAGEVALSYYEYGNGNYFTGYGTNSTRWRYFTLQNGTPTAADDDSIGGIQGYRVGARWVDSNTGRVYICTDNTSGAAVWENQTNDAGASTSGVLRVWHSGGCSLYKNNILVGHDDTLPIGQSFAASYPMDIAVGDYVQATNRVGTGTDNFHIAYLPDSHGGS